MNEICGKRGGRGGGWGWIGQDWGSSYEVPGVRMGKWNQFVSRGMEVYDHAFSWCDAYLNCSCAMSDDTLFLNVSGWNEVRLFSKGVR